MLKKTAIYVIIALGLGIIYISTSKKAMQRISDCRNEHDEWWGVHHPVEGDLVGMSYLYYEKNLCGGNDYQMPNNECIQKEKVKLLLWGDSYTYKIKDSAFPCVLPYLFGRRHFQTLRYTIDTSIKNILLIEVTERDMLDYFSNNSIFDYLKKYKEDRVEDIPVVPETTEDSKWSFDYWMSLMFNHNINSNIEYNLFNYNLFSAPRKIKALLNYRYFDRASGDVILSSDKKYLLLKETVSKQGWSSSYAEVSRETIINTVMMLNQVYQHYKADGFDEVYLSIIPNPASILQPKHYNGLIPAIQCNPLLQMKCIDIYTPFTKTKEEIYRHGDTHWNNNGMSMWVDEVNKAIAAN
jgi:hypothetical protein